MAKSISRFCGNFVSISERKRLIVNHCFGYGKNMKQKRQLDAVDRRIVKLLQADASISHAELAEKVGASSASCWRRIKSLEQAGVLLKAVRLVDPASVERQVNVL